MNREVVAESNGHKWIDYKIGEKMVQTCINCGVIRKIDDSNKKCVGKVRIGLR